MFYTETQARALLANYKLTPATLAHKIDPEWIASPWLMYVAAKIAAGIKRGNARFIISVPPRHGKSRLITTYTSLWIQEIFRTYNIILTSYGADLSKDFGREVRNIIQANSEHLDVRISPDKSQAGGWVNQWGGGMVSTGLGGPITGRGANVLVIDDYIKEIKEAMSQTTRDYIYNWFVTTAYTRIEPNGSCIIVATRWHHDDLIGRILQSDEADQWDYIHLPAIALENDVLGRAVGEPLFPERYPLKVLQERKATLGSFFFNALFQQIPENPDAQLTDPDWIGIVDGIEDIGRMPKARVWDLAASEDQGDFTTGGLYCWDNVKEDITMMNMIRVQKSPGNVEKLVSDTAKADGVGVKIYIEEEPGASGKLLSHHFKTSVLKDFDVEVVPASDGKLIRAQPMLAAAEAGHFKLLKAAWNQVYLDEFKSFPAGAHDDQVDNAAIAYAKMSGRNSASASWGRARKSKRKATTHTGDDKYRMTKNGVLVPRTSGATWRLRG